MNINILRAFEERSFLYLWIGAVFAQVSTHIFNFFLILVVYNLTHSNTAVSLAVLTFTVPAILFATFAGAYVDRWDKQRVLIITNLLRAGLLILFAFSLNNIFLIYFLALIFALLVQFFIPAESPMIPLLVHDKYLLAANALFGLAIFGSILIAYVLSGPLFLFLTPFKMSLFLAGLFIIGSGFIWLIKPHHYRHDKKKVEELNRLSIVHELKATIRLLSNTKEVMHSLMMLSLSQIIILTLATIAPGYAVQVLQIPVEEFTLLFVAPAALGMVIGAIFLVNVFHNKAKDSIIRIGVFLSGIVMLLLPFASQVASRDIVHTINQFLPSMAMISTYHIMLFMAFLLGTANAFVFVPASTILQESTSDEFRGKIYGFLGTSIGILSLVPILLVGGLADVLGVSTVIVGIGVSLLIIWGVLFSTK